jgi:imidazolonepropionase
MKAHDLKPEHAWDRVWIGAHLLTLEGTQGLGERLDTVLAIKDGRIAWLGSREELAAIRWSAHAVTEANGLWITPA